MCVCARMYSYFLACLLVCHGFFICECVHACIVCIYQGGWGLSLKSMVQIKKGECAKGVMTRKREPRGSQGNLLLPGPCELAWGALSHLVLCLSTCTLFAQATVIILMISWLAGSPHRRLQPLIQHLPLDIVHLFSWKTRWGNAVCAETKKEPSPGVEKQSEQDPRIHTESDGCDMPGVA